MARNVATLVDVPRVQRPEPRFLTPGEARQLLEAARGDPLEALCTVALALGLRRGEALGLRWEDVDLEAGRLTVRATLQRIDGKPQWLEPKSARSRRTIPLPQAAVRALRTHRTRQLEDRLLGGSRWQEHGVVFTSSVGTPLEPARVTRWFHSLLERAGLPRMRFHDLRHSCASLLVAQGIHPRVVMEVLGHSQIGLTMNVYAHVSPDLQRQTADVMDAVLGSHVEKRE